MAVPLAPGNADEHKAKFFRVLERLRTPGLATERKVFRPPQAFALANGLAAALRRLDRHVVFMDEITDYYEAGAAPRRRARRYRVRAVFRPGSTSRTEGGRSSRIAT